MLGYFVNAGAGRRLFNAAKEGHGLSNIVSIWSPSHNSHGDFDLREIYLGFLSAAES